MHDMVEELLQNGGDLYKSGKVEAASQLYTSILKAQPTHPDANHNLGVLAVGLGKIQEALPFFETALEANTDTAQFWLSYIDALIKVERMADAQAVFDQAKYNGVEGAGFDQLEQRLNVQNQVKLETSDATLEAHQDRPNIMNTLKLDQALRLAKKKSKGGFIEEARRIYQDVLVKFSKNKRAIDGLNGLADMPVDKAPNVQQPSQDQQQLVINLYNQGQFQQALKQTTILLRQFPNSSVLYNICGAVYNELSQLDASIEAYKKALSLWPDNAEALYNMGNVLQGQNKLEEAIEVYNKALAIKPDFADAYYNMGNALEDQGKLEEAIEAYNKALSIKPDFVEAYYNIGSALQDQGKMEEAIEAYTQALAIKPDYAEAYNNMGNALQELGKLEEALEACNKALAVKSNNAEAYNNMGNALQGQGKLEEAIEAYNKSIALKSDYAVAYHNMGNALKDQGKLDEAIEAYNRALAIKPDYAEVISQAYNVGALMSDWTYISTLENRLLAGQLVGQQSVYGLLALADKPSMHLEKTMGLTSEKYKNTPKFAMKPFQNSKRIKLGYFSSYFRLHPVSILSTQMLEHTDREKFELFAFHYGPDSDDAYNLRLRNTFDHFINVSKMTDKEIAELAYKKGIDIAIEFNGFMHDERIGILAHRPAPVQINYLAYPGTMGADFYDYIIADQTVIPNIQKSHYSENIIYLPDGYMPQDNTRRISNKPISRTSFGLPEHGFVFCCFNNSFKISPQEFDIWMRLLNKIEGSVLWLLKANKWSENNLRNEAGKRGVDVDRLVFADKLPLEEHLGRLRLADLFLDTFNFNAHTTASDSLWAGIPVVTKIGKSFAARVAGSLLTAIELPELITTTEKEYEALALSLATDPNKYTKIKKKLSGKKNSTSLFDTETYTKNLEQAYIQAYQRYADGLPPAEFKVL